jgi:hypothetical protein
MTVQQNARPGVDAGHTTRRAWPVGAGRPAGRAGGPEVVCLCGSMRFLAQMLRVAAEETTAGVIVLAPFAVIAPADQDGEVKARLDALHRHKIDRADRVVVVSDASGYFGESTRGEIAYARAAGIPVTFRHLLLETGS